MNKKAPDEAGVRSGAQLDVILKILSGTPLSASEIASVLGLGTRTGVFKRAIKELLAQGLINRIPHLGKAQQQVAENRLTEKGRRQRD